MAFQPINFAGIEPQGAPAFRNLVQSLMGGYQAGQMPGQMRRQAEAEELQNALRSMQLQQTPQKFEEEMQSKQMQDALRRAQIQKMEREGQLPFGGKMAPGAIGQTQWLDAIKKEYTEESPQYKLALEAYTKELETKDALNDYRKILGNLSNKRFASPLGKIGLELEELDKGILPGSGGETKLTPEEQERIKDKYDLDILKKTTDPAIRMKVADARNVDIALGRVNVDDLTQYGGASGQTRLRRDMLQAALGNTPERYQRYQLSKTYVDTAAKQLRKFYGTSIQEAEVQRINELVNPASWFVDPETAKKKFHAAKDIFESETKTFANALNKSPVSNQSVLREEGSNIQQKKATMRFNPQTGKLEKI